MLEQMLILHLRKTKYTVGLEYCTSEKHRLCCPVIRRVCVAVT